MVRYATKIIFLNGPPRSGKDTLAQALWEENKSLLRMPLAQVLKARTHAALGINKPWNFYENRKDEHLDQFYGLTPRQAYIWFSEKVMKPKFGNDIFARLWFDRFRTTMSSYGHPNLTGISGVLITDVGFIEEVRYIATLFGRKNCTFVSLWRDGCDFKNDSRSYLNPHDIALLCARRYEIENNGSIEDLKQKARMLVEECVA